MIEINNKEIVYDKPIYVGTSMLDLSKLTIMTGNYDIIPNSSENKYNLLHSDTDSLVYSIQRDDVYEWIKQNREHFGLPSSIRPDKRGKKRKMK